ncbi:MAG: hypothetical protein QOF53_4040 [Nocardioidaceae bacterium]|jgi:hypothetical protein|nr:hypothetical protein [Nocardioidaceae bacterium]
MREHRTVTRWLAAVVVAGTLLMGAVAPTQAATVKPFQPVDPGTMQPNDTGWNGT